MPDVRATITTVQTICQENLEAPSVLEDTGVDLGVRVLARGGWGFAAIESRANRRSVQLAVLNAYANALASAKTLKKPIVLVAEPAHVDTWRTPFGQDPLPISLAEKFRVLDKASRIALKVKGVRLTTASLEFAKTRIIFISSEGSHIVQDFMTSACGIDAWAFHNGNYQVRPIPILVVNTNRAAGR